MACLVLVTTLSDTAGARWAGLPSIFPGMSLAVVVVTHLEAGPAEAHRMAKTLATGNLGMIAFRASFRIGCSAIGMGWGTEPGYLMSAVALLAVGEVGRRTGLRKHPTNTILTRPVM